MSTLINVLPAVHGMVAALPFAVPDPDPVQPPGTQGFISIMSWAKWVALALLVLALIFAGVMMAVQSRRGEGGEHVGTIGRVLGGVVVVSAAGALVGFLAT